jgi:hypothetical protein
METLMAHLAEPAPAAVGAPPPRRRLGRRQRQRLARGVQYLIFLAAVLTVVLAADWGRLAEAFFRLDIARGMFPNVVLVALRNTLTYTLLAFAFGLAFMQNFIDLGVTGRLRSGGSAALLNWASALAVAGGFLVIFTEYLEENTAVRYGRSG